MARPEREPHWTSARLREMRTSLGLSLETQDAMTGQHKAVIGSWERGDREPGLWRFDELIHRYGYRLDIVPIEGGTPPPVLTTVDIIVLMRHAVAQMTAAEENRRVWDRHMPPPAESRFGTLPLGDHNLDLYSVEHSAAGGGPS